MSTKVNPLLPLLIALAVVLGLVQLDGFTVYASSFNDFSLSADGGVKASYNESTKLLSITGAGTIEHAKWKAMAKKFHPDYYNPDNFGMHFSWRDDIAEDDMEIRFSGASKAIKLYGSQDYWGMFDCFSGQIHFNGAVDLAPTATDLTDMFRAAPQFNEPLDWDTSNVTNMHNMFRDASSFNQPLDWNTANVTDMSYMFEDASSFNGSLDWDTANVTDMSAMFCGASSFNQPLNWNTSNVTDMSYLFCGASSFNRSLNWDTAQVVNMHAMFWRAEAFNQALDWDTANVTDMSLMFSSAEAFNQPLHFDTSAVTTMWRMFNDATSFNQPVLFDTANVTNMCKMFSGASSFNQPVLFNTANVTNMSTMFSRTTSFNQPVCFDIAKVRDVSYMFNNSAVEVVVLDNVASNQNIEASYIFGSCDNLSFIEFSGLKDATIGGFSAAYTVEEIASGSTVNQNAANNYTFTDNIAYRVYKQGGAVDSISSCSLYPIDDRDYTGYPLTPVPYIGSPSDGLMLDHNDDYILRYSDNVDAGTATATIFGVNDYYGKTWETFVIRTPLTAPTISLSKAGSAIKVAWPAVTGTTGYQVYRADAAAGPYTLFKTTTGLSYTNSGALVPGMPYFYKVRAYCNDGGNYTFSDYSAVKGIYAPGALAKPAAPSLTLDENAGGIRLNWNAQPRITGYQIFRGVSTDKPFSYLKTTSGLAQVYTNISGLNSGRPYYYKIRAYRTADGVTKYGDFSTIKGLFAGTNEPALNAVDFNLGDNNVVSVPNVRVTWTGVSGADGYCVYRWDSVHKNWIGLKATGPNARVYTNINGVVSGKTFFYGMRPLHISGGTTYYGNIGQAKGYKVP